VSDVLKVSGLGRTFGGGVRPLVAVEDVSFALAEGETLGIVGESGCGKSTLARMILKLLPATAGRIEIAGQDVTDLDEFRMRPLRRQIQAVFQDPVSSLNPRMRVRDIVAEPMRAAGVDARARAARVAEMLSIVGMPADAGERYPHAFSGGQRQRIAIARALASNPRIVVCDEATSALDVSVQAQVLNLLRDLQQRFSLSYLLISHDLAVVDRVCDRVAVMLAGRVVEEGTPEQLFASAAHPYTRALLEAVPRTDDPDRRRRLRERARAARAAEAGGAAAAGPVLPADAATRAGWAGGCAYAERCPLALARCRSEAPALSEAGEGRRVACHRAGEVAAQAPAVQ
jgi:ABC-type glutathione transport system ATPase component